MRADQLQQPIVPAIPQNMQKNLPIGLEQAH